MENKLLHERQENSCFNVLVIKQKQIKRTLQAQKEKITKAIA